MSSVETTVYLIRHGERSDCIEDCVIDYEGDPPLTDYGKKQAKLAGQALSDTDAAIIYTSPFLRCVQTARTLAQGFGKPCQICLCTSLGEFICRPWVSKQPILHPLDFLQQECPGLQGVIEELPQFEEATMDAVQRVCDTIKKLAEEHHGKTVILVTHGQGIQSAVEWLSGDELYEIPYASITKLVKEDDCWSCAIAARASHWQSAASSPESTSHNDI